MTRLVTLAVLALLAGPVQAQDADELIGRASKVYRSLASLRADFVQVIDNPMIDSAESRGTLVQAGDAKLSMRFTDPPGEAIVIDGKHVWIYTPSSVPGQVIRAKVPSGGPVYGYNLLAWLLDRPAQRYKASYLRGERIGGHDTDVIELVPAVPDLPFTRAIVWLDSGDAPTSPPGDPGAVRGYPYLCISPSAGERCSVQEDFHFEAPPGVRVWTSSELSAFQAPLSLPGL